MVTKLLIKLIRTYEFTIFVLKIVPFSFFLDMGLFRLRVVGVGEEKDTIEREGANERRNVGFEVSCLWAS